MKQLYVLLLFILTINITFSAVLPPTASISGGTTVCQNATGNVITFTGAGGTAPYTFTYSINGVAQPAISTSNTNSIITLPVVTTATGIFTYTLVSVHDTADPNTEIPSSDSETVIVNAPPTIDFTFNNDNSCSGTSIQFSSSITGTGPYTYSWDFGDGTPISNSQNPSHFFNSLGCGTATFNVVLTITGNGCSVTKTHVVSVKQKPDINFTDINSPFDIFSNCSNAASNSAYSITVGNQSASTCISSFNINWGDGNSQTNVTFPASHTYTSIGAYAMVITAIGINNCVNTKTYTVKNVSNPLGGLNSPGSTQNLCASTSNLQFSISNWGINSLDTTYTINYGDGSPILTLSQNQLIASSYYNSTNPSLSSNYPIPHIYSTSSCPASSFVVTLDVTNACGTTPFTLGNITVFTKPTANFSAPTIGCVNNSVLFNNTTIAGYGQSCNQSSIFTWNFGDGTPIITTTPSSPQNINHTFLLPGIYTITLTAQNFCGTTIKTQQICIEPPLIPTFTVNTNSGCIPLAVTTNNTTSAINQCSTTTYSWNVTYAATNCGTTAAFTYTNGTSSSSTSPSFNFTEAGTYTIKLTASNSCSPPQTTTQTVIIKKPPTVTISAIGNTCGTANINPVATVPTCVQPTSSLSYAWSFPGGNPSTANTANPGTINYPTAGNYTVSLIVTNECGPSNTATQSFIVNPTPAITNSSLSQIVCSGSATTLVNLTSNPAATTYSWTATATSGITGFIASGTTNTIPVQTIVTTSTTAGTVTYVITPSIGTCVGSTVNYVITVNPLPTITPLPASNSVCVGGNPTPLTITLSSSAVTPTYQWYSNTVNSNTGGALILGATNATYNPPASTAGTFYYYCVVSLSSGGCSSLSSNVATVIVNPLPTITSQPIANQSICVGGTISALSVSYTGGLGTANYQWYSNTNNTTSGGNPVGTNSTNYTPPVFNAVGTYYYYVIISLSGNGCGNVTSTVGEINVLADPTVTSQPLTTQTLCQNSSPTPLVATASGGIGTYTYQWYSNANNSTPAGTIIAGATSQTFTPPTNLVGTKYYYCIISQSAVNCNVTSTIATVVINTSPTIQNQPASSTVCQNGIPTTLTFTYTNGVGTPTYQWYSNTTNSNTGGSSISGATNSTYIPLTSTIGSVYYYCIITFPGLAGNCANVATNPATVTVNPAATMDLQPIPTQNICVGGTIQNPLSVSFINGTGTASYQWFSNTTNSNSGGTSIPGATSATYTPPIFTAANSYFYYAVISFTGNGCGSITSAVAEIVVVSDPVVSTQPIVTQTLCQNATPNALEAIASGGIGDFSYQWYATTTATTTGGTAVGTNSPSFTPPTNTVGSYYYYCAITQTGIGCAVNTNSSIVIINTSPTIANQPISSTVCQNGVPTTLSFTYTNGVGTPTYQWFSNTTNSNTGGSSISGATNSTYTPVTSTIGYVYYYCIITFSGLAGNCANVATNTATVTVNPAATMDVQPLPTQSICVGGTIQNPLSVSFINGTGTPSYQWFSNATNSNSGGTSIPGATSTAYTPPVFTITNSYFYYVVISFTGNGCGNVTSNVAEVVVVSDPTVSSQPITTQTLCQNESPTNLTVVAIDGIGTFNYQWYATTTATNTGGTAVGTNSPSFNPPTNTVGIFYYYCAITQTGVGCAVNSNSSIVIINTSPTIVNQPISSTVCQNGAPTILSFTYTNGVGTPTYQWFSNTTNSNIGGILIPNETNSSFIPSSINTGIFYYYGVISFPNLVGSCSNVATNVAIVTINPPSTVDVQPLPTQNICVGGTIQNALTVSFINGTGTASYQWFSNTTNSNSGGTLISGATSATYTPSILSTVGSFYYYVIISFTGNGCGNVTSNVAEVVVVSDPTVSSQPIASQTLCQNETPTNLTVVAIDGIGTYNYQWYSTTTATTTGGTFVGTNSPSFTPPTNSVGIFYYYCAITQTGVGCAVNSNSSTVIINLSPTIVNQPISSTICQNGAPTILSFTYANGVGTPTYQWFSNTSNSNTGGNLISGEINPTFIPPSLNTGIFYYYGVISFPNLVGSCSSIATNPAVVTINPPSTIDVDPLPNQSICVGGTIQNPLSVSFINGTGTASYQWFSNATNSNSGGTLISGATSVTYTPPVLNTVGSFYYYVVISFTGNGCGNVTSNVAEVIVVSDPTVSSQPIASQTLCQNAIPNLLQVTASGGIGTFSYQWYSNTTNTTIGGTLLNGETNNNYSPPTSNNGTLYYYCIITQPTGIGCNVTSQTSQINVNLAPTIATNPASETICLGDNITPLTVNYTNGVGTANYQWFSNTSNSNVGGTIISNEINATFSPSSSLAGTYYYYCVISFPSLNGGCEIITSNPATITINQVPVISSQMQTICSSTNFNIIPVNSLSDIVPVGTTYTWSAPTISPIGAITGSSGESTGQTSISQTLVNSSTSPATATYTVTPTSGNCIGTNFTIVITINPSTNPNAIVTNSTCFGINNGTITTNITGGIPFTTGAPYTILWTGPNSFTSSATTISNLEPGIYNLSINDAGGCPISNNYTITEPADIILSTDFSNNITCFGSNNGSIAISVIGGTGAYTYSWTQNNLPYAITEDITNLSPATYIVSVSDANNCGPKTLTFIITEPPLLVATIATQTNVNCYGFSTGAITISTTGGTPIQVTPGIFEYIYSWTGTNGFTSNSQNLNNLPAGVYNLIVTDNLGCTANLSVTITQSPEIIITAVTTPIVCYNDNNATITTTVSGGNAPYQIQWSNLATGLNLTDLSPGNYTITITDNLGCQKSLVINIPSPPIFDVNPVVTNISCFGAHNGSIVLNFVGGIAPVNLVWSDGNPAGTTRNNLGPGTYSVIITDSKPCTISRSFTILEPQPLILSANTTNALDCNNANTGAINLLVSGGTPPFNYVWNNGITTEDLNNIPAGNYLVTVTDANGCTKTEQYSITRPNPIVLSVNTTTTANCDIHSVTQNFAAQVSGGVPPFQFNWSSGMVSGSNNEFMTTTQNGLITLTATDAIGCSATYSLNVDIPTLGNPTFSPTSIGYISYDIYSIQDPIQFQSVITGDYISVVWDFGDGTFSNELNPIHTYLIPNEYYLVKLTVTYPFGCVYVNQLALNVEKGYLLVVPTAFTPNNNDGINDTLRPVTKGLKKIHLDVYDTWGSLIYSEVGDVIIGWNGKIKNIDSENGNYYVKVSAETFYGTIINENRTFVLIK